MFAPTGSRARSLSLRFHQSKADPAATTVAAAVAAAVAAPTAAAIMTKFDHTLPPSHCYPAGCQGQDQQQHTHGGNDYESGPLKTPHHHVSCAVITPPATPPVPRPVEDSHCNFSAPAQSQSQSQCDDTDNDTCSLTKSQSHTTSTYSSRQEYMESLVPPSRHQFEKIAEVQREKETEIKRNNRTAKRRSLQSRGSDTAMSQDGDQQQATGPDADGNGDAQQVSQTRTRGSTNSDDMKRAATLIQRNYRGYRVRREMEGFSIDPTTRWMSAIEEARFREMNRPRAKSSVSAAGMSLGGDQRSIISRDSDGGMRPTTARDNWRKAATIARRAGHDDSDSDSDSSLSSSDSRESPEERAERRRRYEEAKEKRKKDSKMMGLQYFLEMVDLKHRYGSNLRVYHEEWKKSDTNENFFYWLDYGGGKNLEMEACPRDRLEREQVRYLSREERQYYLVQVDEEGRLCWAKNGARIDTTEAFKDSIHGIVPADDATPAWSQSNLPPPTPASWDEDDSRSESSVESALEADRAAKYATPDFDGATGVKKVSHISAATVFNKMLRKSVKKNTWIFVADTSFRLYVGIKSSGAFQHSSFLGGSRISAAGLIKVKDGRLSSLSPLSGHYRPPASNFRSFVKNLKDSGVDTSHVAISKSYAVLVGLEVYVKSRQKSKRTLEKLTLKKEKIVAPEEFRKREEEERDKSESAAKEREVLEREAEEREQNRAAVKLMRKLRLSPREPRGGAAAADAPGAAEGQPSMEPLAEQRTREERAVSGA